MFNHSLGNLEPLSCTKFLSWYTNFPRQSFESCSMIHDYFRFNLDEEPMTAMFINVNIIDPYNWIYIFRSRSIKKLQGEINIVRNIFLWGLKFYWDCLFIVLSFLQFMTRVNRVKLHKNSHESVTHAEFISRINTFYIANKSSTNVYPCQRDTPSFIP